PGPWLLANVPWTEARHRIIARGATAVVARHLGVPEGAPCLVVERRIWNGDVPVTFARLWYPGEDHALEGRFLPSW
ncbi:MULTISPECIES: UTRA domain-containing protein, partial [unclassified Novosphingobium]|uniref:UTRA domain-containing protein n=1 Tax=unclassified Novosphingobium TaxID=2644732 RepID=UPI00146F44EF